MSASVDDPQSKRRRGYFRVYRSVVESPIFGDSRLLRVWIYCMAKATHRPRTVSIKAGRGTVQVELSPGQFIWGARSAAADMRDAKTNVDRALKTLEKRGSVVREPGRHFTVVTLLNWRSYQSISNDSGTLSGFLSGTQSGTRNGTQSGPKQEQEQTHTNKHIEQNRAAESARSSGKSCTFTVDAVEFPPSLDTFEARKAAAEWLDHKRARRESYPSPASFAKKLAEWARAGPEAFVAAVNSSIGNNYAGIFAPNGGTNDNRKGHTAGPGQSYDAGAQLEGF